MNKKAYKVTLICINALGNKCHNQKTDKYYDCIKNTACVITDDPCEIYELFGTDNVMNIERTGIGYVLQSKINHTVVKKHD